MFEYDILIQKILDAVERHKLEPGKYARFLWQNDSNSRELGYNAYGCADAANILYTLNYFPSDPKEREQWIASIQGKQDEETGFFMEPTHHDFHTTAQCVGALELFDAKPKYPLKIMEEYLDYEKFRSIFEEVDWLHRGIAAHPGAAIYAALTITDRADEDWVNYYFSYLDEHCNPENGMWTKEPTDKFPVHFQMGDAFHYLFNYENAKHPMPYPEKLIDSCLAIYKEGKFPEDFGKMCHYIEMDWVYCLNRASRQTPHRFYEVKETLYQFAKEYIDVLLSLDWEKDESVNDLHLLFGTTCCLAELQQALPGKFPSKKPMRLVLDRRPFI